MKLPFTDQYEAYRAVWEGLESRIAQGIDTNRKGDASLRLVEGQGRPVTGAEVRVVQKTHAFRFGCNALLLGQLGDMNEVYEKKIAGLFNLVTTTFCWNDLETAPGIYRFEEGSEEIFRRPPPDRVVNFGRRYGLALKGQPLLADSWFPQWAPKDPEQLKRLYTGFFEKVAQRYGKEFAIWDVVNESFCCEKRRPDFPLYTPELDYVEWAFREAKRIFPKDGGLLEINEASFVNDGPLADRYYEQVKGLKQRDAGVGSVGFQFHMFNTQAGVDHLEGRLYPPESIYENYLRFSGLGLPMYITEITVPSKFDCDRETGQVLQAEMVRNLYRLWFSIPAMAGIIYWNFKDGPAWRSEGDCLGCLTDENLGEKPAYRALDELIHGEWKTNLTLRPDSSGRVSFRGFYGQYDISVVTADGTRTLCMDVVPHGENEAVITL